MSYKLLATKKLYYGTYPYKITLSFWNAKDKRGSRSRNAVVDLQSQVWDFFTRKYTFRRVDTWKKDWLFRISESYYKDCVYFKNHNDVEEFMATFNEYIESYERPESAEQLAALENEAKIVIKEQLYFNTFRWRLSCKIKTMADSDEIHDWLVDYGQNAGWKSYEDWVFTSSSGSIYLRDEKQIMLLRLLLGPKVKFVEKVLLKSEVDKLNEVENG